MVRIVLLPLLLLLGAAPAEAGIRAAYSGDLGGSLQVSVNDQGDAVVRTGDYRRIILKGGDAYIVEERLTGPIVTRAADLDALSKPARYGSDKLGFQPLGARVIKGRTGQAYGWPKSATNPREILLFVIGGEPALRPLGLALRRYLEVETIIARHEGNMPEEARTNPAPIYALLDQGAPLQFQAAPLHMLEFGPVGEDELALPGPPESREQLAARLKGEAEEEKRQPSNDTMILRAAYADRQLWLLTDDGKLSSIAEGEQVRKPAALAVKVVDICAGKAGLLALAKAGSGDGWTLQMLNGGQWQSGRTIVRAGDSPVALDCSGETPVLLTVTRLIDLGSGASLKLSRKLGQGGLRATVHVTPQWVFIGFNAGEWGGGLQRINRRTGKIAAVEKNSTGGLCDGPLNTACDPVNGIVTIPWRPGCVAAAIGLIHFMAHGRIASICPDGVEQLVAVPSDPYLTGKSATDAATGGYGAVAFFGIVGLRDGLLAAGHNGLYRITPEAKAERQPRPLFKRIGGVLVSFERADVVLVMSELNRRASISGISPLMVPR